MVGATQMVDMVTSKNSDFGRALVTVLDLKAIPGPLGVVIRDRWFEFPIEVNNINHRVESYVEISTDQGDKDDNNEDENDDLMGDDDLMGGGFTKSGQHNARSGSKFNSDVDMDGWRYLRMQCSQVNKLLVTNLKLLRQWLMRF